MAWEIEDELIVGTSETTQANWQIERTHGAERTTGRRSKALRRIAEPRPRERKRRENDQLIVRDERKNSLEGGGEEEVEEGPRAGSGR